MKEKATVFSVTAGISHHATSLRTARDGQCSYMKTWPKLIFQLKTDSMRNIRGLEL